MSRPAISVAPVKKISPSGIYDATECVAVEEPLEIRLEYGPSEKRIAKSISVTMRTPGYDHDLAAGFLYTEGIIKNAEDITSIKHCNGENENVVKVALNTSLVPAINKLDRNFYTTSSCGVCGKSSIEAVMAACSIAITSDNIQVASSLIYRLPDLLRKKQELFDQTGGLHGCALFTTSGKLLILREDVGRHNALDKLIGYALNNDMLPFQDHVLMLSGRASFELIQKAMMAGIKIVVAVGAPSSLAVEMATEWEMTLIGFLRDERFNIYTGMQRITT